MPFQVGNTISNKLSEKAYGDLCFDILSEGLKNELMVIRIKEGRDLTEFVKFAKGRNAFTVATWIDHMNPGEFPTQIQHKKYETAATTGSDKFESKVSPDGPVTKDDTV